MSYTGKSYVTMEKKLCPICGHEHETNSLLLDTMLRERFDHYTVTGYEHCEECKGKLKEDYIALVEVSNQGVEQTLKQENAVRTGQLVWIRKSAAKEIFNTEITTPMAFVQPAVVEFLKTLTPSEQ